MRRYVRHHTPGPYTLGLHMVRMIGIPPSFVHQTLVGCLVLWSQFGLRWRIRPID